MKNTNNGAKITPHKGGRTERIELRMTPQVNAIIKKRTQYYEISRNDYINALVLAGEKRQSLVAKMIEEMFKEKAK